MASEALLPAASEEDEMSGCNAQFHFSDSPNVEYWDDVTTTFQRAKEEMEVGEMIHLESFNLHAAMSAIELMDPKMDIGVGKVRDASEVVLPTELSDSQVINVMDQLLICEMSWLDGHTLPQTVFSCVYAQRMYDIPRVELFSFLRVQIATMDTVLNIVLDEKVADDEDFIASTYGFNLRPLSSDPDESNEAVLQKILQKLSVESVTAAKTKAMSDAIALRVRLQVALYRVIQCLASMSVEQALRDAPRLLRQLQNLAICWKECPHRRNVDAELIEQVFDASINRHLMTSAPPRTAPLFDHETALAYLQRLLLELSELVQLEAVMLPWKNTETAVPTSRRCSLQVAIHGAAFYAAKFNPTILTRSIMSRIMIPEYSASLFAKQDAEFGKLLGTDLGYTEEMMTSEVVSSFATVWEGTFNTFKCLCRNRSRQRRQVLRLVRWWDHYAFVTSQTDQDNVTSQSAAADTGVPPNAHAGNTTGLSNQPDPTDAERRRQRNLEAQGALDSFFNKKTAIQVVCYEVSARLMIQHWMLGFECELYQEYEYGAVFFYVGYVLTTLSNATTSLANKSLKGSSLHPLRFALYTMDEARLWMCRAMHATLEALSRGQQWDYHCGRAQRGSTHGLSMFGSEELWYEQRFGVVRGMVNGPDHADYASYLSFKKVHEESLVARSKGTDIIPLLLKDAANGFLTARRTLERAKKTAQTCSRNHVSEELLQIARVAVANSLTLSQVLTTYASSHNNTAKTSRFNVNFSFQRHRHFPVIEITQA